MDTDQLRAVGNQPTLQREIKKKGREKQECKGRGTGGGTAKEKVIDRRCTEVLLWKYLIGWECKKRKLDKGEGKGKKVRVDDEQKKKKIF